MVESSCSNHVIQGYFHLIVQLVNVSVIEWTKGSLDLNTFLDKMQTVIDGMRTCV